MDTDSNEQNPNSKIPSIDTNSIDTNPNPNPKNSSVDTNTIDQSPKTSLIDELVDQNPSLETNTNSIEKNPNPKSTSIDHSLDAIENQLESISLDRKSEISPNSSNNSINDELYSDAPSRLPSLDDNGTPIGLPNDQNSALSELALDGDKNDDNNALSGSRSGLKNHDNVVIKSEDNNDDNSKRLSGLNNRDKVVLESGDNHDANKAPSRFDDKNGSPSDDVYNALSKLPNYDFSAPPNDDNNASSGSPSGLTKNLNVALESGDNNDDISAPNELPNDDNNASPSGLTNDHNVALESGDNIDEKKGVSGLPSDVTNKGLSGLENDGDDNVVLKSGDRVLSQSSLGGYERERESNGGSTSGISEVGVVDGSNQPAVWLPGKRHVHEDDGSVSWRKRKKHFFILSHSGKPIYSRYGDEHKLAGFSATLQAIVSFVEDGKDRIQLVRAGKHQVVFLVKGPIYLVCISCTEEPYESLRAQLELIYGQMIVILTQSVNRCFEKNSKFDMTPLLGGTDVVFSSLIHSFSWNPATFLHAYTCLPLAYATRQAAGAILQDVADSGVLFAILMCKHKVVSLVGAQKASLHPDDMLLLSNFVMSSESFRTSESFSPICLPRYNPMAFLYAYVQYLDVDTYLMLLTTSSNAFYHLKDCRILIENVLLKSNVLSEVQRSMLDGGMHVEDVPLDTSSRSSSPQFGQPKLVTDTIDRISEGFVGVGGPSGLWHFIYRSIYLNQYVSSEFSSPINSSRQQKRLYRAYQNLFSSMHEEYVGPHKTQFRRDEHFVLLCWVTPDFELYAAFDPLADKALAIKTCNRVCQWVKDVENEIFLLGASPFSW